MTYRERKEARLARRLDWAAGRRDKAAALRPLTERYRGDIAFNTQPGHIPERARVIRATDKSAEHQTMAAEHESKAAEIARQLDRSIYSDDPDALDALAAKIVALEASQAQMVRVNAAWRKSGKPKADDAEAWRKVADALGCSDNDLHRVRAEMARDFCHRAPFTYHLQNNGGNISRLKKRVEDVKARQTRMAQADAAPGGVVIEGAEWVRVTFADKPERAIIDALKAAGFSWGAGHWSGERAKLPVEVTA
jgi:hypothetical protein